MKRFLLLTLCAALLLGAAIPAYADVDFSWWKYIPGATDPGKATATPKPTATPKTSSSCSMCDGTGYTALKTGTGEYVAVACPQCSNGGSTNTASSTSQFEETVQSFMNYVEKRFADHDMDFALTKRDKELEDIYKGAHDKPAAACFVVPSTNAAHILFESFATSDDIEEIMIYTYQEKYFDTVLYTGLFLIEATGQISDDFVDWVFDTATRLLSSNKKSSDTYELDSNIVKLSTYDGDDITFYIY